MSIELRHYTLDACHAFWRDYASDPAMWAEDYIYDQQSIDRYYKSKVQAPDRCFFAICHGDQVVGETQLKYIDYDQGIGTLSIHFANDAYKNRGWGTQAIRLMLSCAFDTLQLKKVYADSFHRNLRSQHVLEKCGFRYLREDEFVRYYEIKREDIRTIRLAQYNDLEHILAVYETAREYMIKNGNPGQWGKIYPERSMLEDDIARRQLFVDEEGGSIHGVFMFRIGEDETYARIEGAWLSERPYGTIHRVASDGLVKGVFSRCVAFCKARIPRLRIDTHEDNHTMRRLIERQGFVYCGTIYVEDGSPRRAYEYISAQ